MGSSKEEEFRQRAEACRQRAARATGLDIKQSYLDLADHWTFLADQTAKATAKPRLSLFGSRQTGP
jgi:hypothetical protein